MCLTMAKAVQVLQRKEVLGREIDFYGTWDDPMFLAKDVAEWIEHSKASIMLASIDEDEKLRETIFTSGQNREVWFVTEDGLYEVLMQSRKPIAKQLKKEIKLILKEIRTKGMFITEEATHEQVTFNVDVFFTNLDNYNVINLYTLVEDFLTYHRDKKTRLPFKRSHKARHGNKKYKDHLQSMEEVRDYLVDYLNAKISLFNKTNQAGLAQEYIRIREMVRVTIENMRYRSAACR